MYQCFIWCPPRFWRARGDCSRKPLSWWVGWWLVLIVVSLNSRRMYWRRADWWGTQTDTSWGGCSGCLTHRWWISSTDRISPCHSFFPLGCWSRRRNNCRRNPGCRFPSPPDGRCWTASSWWEKWTSLLWLNYYKDLYSISSNSHQINVHGLCRFEVLLRYGLEGYPHILW